MPTKRTKRIPERIGIRAEVIEAWKRADFRELHRLCGLAPCEPSPLPMSLHAYGVREGPPPAGCKPFWARGWGRALQLQRTLLAVARPPGEPGA
jgi:hypothetical protein